MVGRGSVGMSPPRGCPGTPRIFDAEAPTLSPEGNSPPGGREKQIGPFLRGVRHPHIWGESD